MVIGKYIRLLLVEGKMVVLPGFGNLEMKKTAGAGTTGENLMEPPGLRIRFDSGFSKDDGNLAESMASGEQMDPEEARQQVLELVDAIKFSLDKGESFQVEGVGSFTRDTSGKVHFRIDRDWVLHPEQFGLEPLDLLELDEEEEIEQVPREPVEIGSNEAFAVEPEPFQPAQRRPPSGKPPPRAAAVRSDLKERRAGRWRTIWMVAGVLIIILVVLIMIPTDKLNIPGRMAVPPPVTSPPGPEGTAASPRDAEEAGEGADFERLTPESLGTEETGGNERQPPDAEMNKYFLIAGSFSHLKNASDLQDQLKSRGVDAEVMITENRMYRVSVGGFATIGEAESELARMKSKPGLESCWILSN